MMKALETLRINYVIAVKVLLFFLSGWVGQINSIPLYMVRSTMEEWCRVYDTVD